MPAKKKLLIVLIALYAVVGFGVCLYTWQVFGKGEAWVLAAIYAIPILLSLSLFRDWNKAKTWQQATIVVLLLGVSCCVTPLLIHNWYDEGMRFTSQRDLEFELFCQKVEADPAFVGVETAINRFFRARYVVTGFVRSQADWDKLKKLSDGLPYVGIDVVEIRND